MASLRFRCIAVFFAVISIACQSSKQEASAGVASDRSSEFSDAEGAVAMSEAPIPALESIYFDFDKAAIRADQRETLGPKAEQLKLGSWNRITIAGHCDQRGSDEYNLALGERRANAVRQQLVDLGVEASRLDTVSYGEARPAVQGGDESAWKWNRRAEFSSVQ